MIVAFRSVKAASLIATFAEQKATLSVALPIHSQPLWALGNIASWATLGASDSRPGAGEDPACYRFTRDRRGNKLRETDCPHATAVMRPPRGFSEPVDRVLRR
jgi:hypothetical protein